VNIYPVGFIDPGMIHATLALKYEHYFQADTRRQDAKNSPHHDTETILLRGPQDPNQTNWFEDVPHVDTVLLQEWRAAQNFLARVEQAIAQSTSQQAARFGKAMLVRLKPGGWVDWHVDTGPYADAHMRFHIAIAPCWGAWLYSGGEGMSLAPGNLMFFNNRVIHSATNFGDCPRVSLICDVRRPPLQ
jgi:Aspartyl/Asparaginyl beta-hydroxylase